MSTIPHGKLQQSLFFNLVVPALFGQAFRFDNDEGLELIKAALYSEDFPFTPRSGMTNPRF